MNVRLTVTLVAMAATVFAACGGGSNRECTNNQACDSGEICINHVCVATSGGWQEPDQGTPTDYSDYWNVLNGTVINPPQDCNDNNVCSVDYYDGKECQHAIVNYLGCNDNDNKTAYDVCMNGVCAGVPYNCDDSLSCTEDTWNGNGTCGHALNSGTCLIGGKCYADGGANTQNACQICAADTKPTAWSFAAAGTACNDNNALTCNDVCNNAGVCAGTPVACAADSDCDDNLACTTDTCNASNECEATVMANYCLIGGECYADNDADPANICLVCDSATAADAWSNAANTTTCDDGNAGTIDDICTDGVCAGIVPDCMVNDDCNDNLDCTTDICNDSNECENTLMADYCLIEDVCYAEAAADPANVCLVCDSATATDAWTNAANTTSCDDENAGTINDICTDGVCAGIVPDCLIDTDCNDNLDCTTDTCNASNECENNLMADYCLIDTVCYANDAVNAGNICLVCDSAEATDAWSNADSTTACDDGNACTVNDVCQSGMCAGTAMDCDDSVSCTEDTCFEGSCMHALYENTCLIDNVCYNSGDPNILNECMVCDDTSALQWSAVPDGTACTPPTPTKTTATGTCQSGVCVQQF